MNNVCEICGKVIENCQSERVCENCKNQIVEKYYAYVESRPRRKMKKCLVCGREIKSKSYTTCSETCKAKLKQITTEYRKTRADDLRKKKTAQNKEALRQQKERNMSNIGKRIKEARQQGLTYGQYMGLIEEAKRKGASA